MQTAAQNCRARDAEPRRCEKRHSSSRSLDESVAATVVCVRLVLIRIHGADCKLREASCKRPRQIAEHAMQGRADVKNVTAVRGLLMNPRPLPPSACGES